jgi:hypothetical protein
MIFFPQEADVVVVERDRGEDARRGAGSPEESSQLFLQSFLVKTKKRKNKGKLTLLTGQSEEEVFGS